MGRNNKELRGKDVNWGYNQKKKKPFKFEFLNEHDCRMLEVANGLEIKDISMAIKINGKVDIELNDTLTIKGVNKFIKAKHLKIILLILVVVLLVLASVFGI